MYQTSLKHCRGIVDTRFLILVLVILQEMLQDAKEMFSNREVIRQINQFLDELLSDNDSQTPPTPSDSSLNSLAQIAQVQL